MFLIKRQVYMVHLVNLVSYLLNIVAPNYRNSLSRNRQTLQASEGVIKLVINIQLVKIHILFVEA